MRSLYTERIWIALAILCAAMLLLASGAVEALADREDSATATFFVG